MAERYILRRRGAAPTALDHDRLQRRLDEALPAAHILQFSPSSALIEWRGQASLGLERLRQVVADLLPGWKVYHEQRYEIPDVKLRVAGRQ